MKYVSIIVCQTGRHIKILAAFDDSEKAKEHLIKNIYPLRPHKGYQVQTVLVQTTVKTRTVQRSQRAKTVERNINIDNGKRMYANYLNPPKPCR